MGLRTYTLLFICVRACQVTSVVSNSWRPYGLQPTKLLCPWSGSPCPPPGDLLNPGIKPAFPTTPALQVDSLPLSHQGSPFCLYTSVLSEFLPASSESHLYSHCDIQSFLSLHVGGLVLAPSLQLLKSQNAQIPYVKMAQLLGCYLVAQVCPTLCDPMDCSPSGSSVYGISQARTLKWVAFSFSRGSSRPTD